MWQVHKTHLDLIVQLTLQIEESSQHQPGPSPVQKQQDMYRLCVEKAYASAQMQLVS